MHDEPLALPIAGCEMHKTVSNCLTRLFCKSQSLSHLLLSTTISLNILYCSYTVLEYGIPRDDFLPSNFASARLSLCISFALVIARCLIDTNIFLVSLLTEFPLLLQLQFFL